MTYRGDSDAWETLQDPAKHSRFCKSLPSRKTSDLIALLTDRETLCAVIGSRHRFTVNAAVREISEEIDRRLPAREYPLNLQAIARVWPEGGEHKHEADDQVLVEYDLMRTPGGTERALAIATIVRHTGIGVQWGHSAYRPGGTAVFDVLDIWQSSSFRKLPVVSHDEATQRVSRRLTELNQDASEPKE